MIVYIFVCFVRINIKPYLRDKFIYWRYEINLTERDNILTVGKYTTCTYTVTTAACDQLILDSNCEELIRVLTLTGGN